MNKTNITIGMGGFHGFNGDRYPFTVVEVLSDKKIVIQEDGYKVIEENCGHKEGPLRCKFYRCTYARKTILTLRKNNRWIPQGTGLKSGWAYILGERAYSRNPHF